MMADLVRRKRALVAAAALTLALALPASLAAQEKTVEDRVTELVPRLLSEQDEIRTRAERDLFLLGDAARPALARMAQEDDARRSDLALRLLNSDRWPEPAERLLEREVASGGAPLPRVRRDLHAELDAMRRRVRELLRTLPRFPDLPEPGALLDGGLRHDLDALADEFPTWARGSSAGSMFRDGERIEWRVDSEGRVSATRTLPGGDPRDYVADDMAAFRATHPEVAGRLDETMAGWGRVRAFPREFRLPELLPRLEFAPRQRADRPLLGIEWEQPSAALRSHVRLGRGGLLVTRVVPGSRAERLGLRVHDVLVKLGGSGVALASDVSRVLREAGDHTLTAEIIRAGERRQLTETR